MLARGPSALGSQGPVLRIRALQSLARKDLLNAAKVWTSSKLLDPSGLGVTSTTKGAFGLVDLGGFCGRLPLTDRLLFRFNQPLFDEASVKTWLIGKFSAETLTLTVLGSWFPQTVLSPSLLEIEQQKQPLEQTPSRHPCLCAPVCVPLSLCQTHRPTSPHHKPSVG